MTRILFSLAILAVTLCATAQANTNEEMNIPIEVTSTGHLVVDLTLHDGEPLSAIFDTGATFAMVGGRTAARIGLIEDENGRLIDIVGLGVKGTYPVVDLGPVRFGGADSGPLTAALNRDFSLKPTDTVLPARFLPHRTLDFDFEKESLSAYDSRPRRVYHSTTSRLPVTWIHGLPFIKVEVNGKSGLALVDTGASNTFINSAFADKAARADKDFGLIEVTSSTGVVKPLRILSSRRFTFGDFKMRHFEVIVIDPAFLETVGLQDQPIMVMGLDILQHFRLQLDRDGNRLHLSKRDRRVAKMPSLFFDYN